MPTRLTCSSSPPSDCCTDTAKIRKRIIKPGVVFTFGFSCLCITEIMYKVHNCIDTLRAALFDIQFAALQIEIAKTDEDESIRVSAAKKITETAALIEMAKTDASEAVRKAAAAQIMDAPALIEIAKTNADPWVRAISVRKISDEAILAEIARTDISEAVRRAAINRISDESILLEFAMNSEDRLVCYDAVRQIHDDRLLAEIIGKDTDLLICEIAFSMLRGKRIAKKAVDILSARYPHIFCKNQSDLLDHEYAGSGQTCKRCGYAKTQNGKDGAHVD